MGGKKRSNEIVNKSIKKQAQPLLIQEAYRQHWLHARHVEIERLLFTSILTALIMGVLVGIKDRLFDLSNVPLMIFLMFVSFLGVMFTVKVACIFRVHTSWAKKILDDYGLKDLWHRYSDKAFVRKFHVEKIFPIYFWFFFSFISTVLIHVFIRNEIYSVIFFSVIFFVIGTIVYRLDFSKCVGSLKDLKEVR